MGRLPSSNCHHTIELRVAWRLTQPRNTQHLRLVNLDSNRNQAESADMKSIDWVFGTLWRGVVVGVAYIAAMMVVGMLFGVLGLVPAASGNATVSLTWVLIAGILLGLYLGPLAARTTATRRQHVLIWTAVIFFNMGAVMLEGAYLRPRPGADSGAAARRSAVPGRARGGRPDCAPVCPAAARPQHFGRRCAAAPGSPGCGVSCSPV